MGQIVSKALVEIILSRFVQCLKADRFSVLQRDKNRYFILSNSLTRERICEMLCKLKVDDYWQSEPSKIVPDGIVHKFFSHVTVSNLADESREIIIHVKFELIELDDLEKAVLPKNVDPNSADDSVSKTVVISFHEAEYPAEYAFR